MASPEVGAAVFTCCYRHLLVIERSAQNAPARMRIISLLKLFKLGEHTFHETLRMNSTVITLIKESQYNHTKLFAMEKIKQTVKLFCQKYKYHYQPWRKSHEV